MSGYVFWLELFPFDHLRLSVNFSLKKSLLLTAQFIVKIDKNIGSRNLHQALVNGLKEHYVLLVKMRKKLVSQNHIYSFPVASNHALLV